VDIVDRLGRETDAAARGHAVGFGDVAILQPGEEGDELGAGDGCERGVVGEEDEQFIVAVAVIEDGVIAAAGGAFVEEASLGSLR